MNLQVCVPYEKCVFNCPMCVAKGHKHNYDFENTYKEDKEFYKIQLNKIIQFYKDFIITGECDPTQNIGFVKDVSSTIKAKEPKAKVELQTHNYHVDINELQNIDVLSYSITNVKEYLRAYKFPKLQKGINRLVILLTKEFAFLNRDNFNPMGFEQITFKILQDSEDENINKWIAENKLENLTNIYDIVNTYNGSDVSVRIDTSCQTAKGRYEIFRSDACVYENWETKTKW